MINCIVPNLTRRADRWSACYNKLLDLGFPAKNIQRFAAYDGRQYITPKIAEAHARAAFNGDLPSYLTAFGDDPFYYCWHWTWYSILNQISESEGDELTLVLIDDKELLMSYDEICNKINGLRSMSYQPEIIQISIPRKESRVWIDREPVDGLPFFRKGLAGRSDCAMVFSADGAKRMVEFANRYPNHIPAYVVEEFSREADQTGCFAVNHEPKYFSQFGGMGSLAVGNSTSAAQTREEARYQWYGEKTLKELIEDKTVAVVGRSQYLADIEQGDFIDSHDVVIRIHNPLPHPQQPRDILINDDTDSFVPEDWHNQIGRNTQMFAGDLAYQNHFTTRDIFRHFRKTGGKLCIVHKFYNVVESIRQIDIIQDEFMPVYIASLDNFIVLSRQMDYAFPLPGTLLIYEILRCNPKTLYHTGFSCFQDDMRLTAQAEVTLARQHHPILDLRFLRGITTLHDCITTDEFMMSLFEREKEKEI